MKAVTQLYLFNKKLYKSGKTKTLFELENDKLLFFFTDKITANNILMKEGVPEKGKVQRELSKFWFEFLKERKIVENHFLSQKLSGPKIQGLINYQDKSGNVFQDFLKNFPKEEIEQRLLIVKRVDRTIPLSFIVKGYLIGSQPSFVFPKVRKGGQFPSPLVEILVDGQNGKKEKADWRRAGNTLNEWKKVHNLNIAPYMLPEYLVSKSLKIYKVCLEFAEEKGVIIAEAKFEFGFDKDGNLLLIDEVLTPDTARFWLKEAREEGRFREHYDKKFLLDWLENIGVNEGLPPPKLPEELIKELSQRYQEILKRLIAN